MKKIVIYGGGTINKVRPHLAISAPAYGKTARFLAEVLASLCPEYSIDLRLTRMAGGDYIETNDDLQQDIQDVVSNPDVKCVIMSAAVADFRFSSDNPRTFPVEGQRLSSSTDYDGGLIPTPKLLNTIRKQRKDIFLVGFKTTTNCSPVEQFNKGLTLLKNNSCNLVLANDLTARRNIIITPEEAMYDGFEDQFGYNGGTGRHHVLTVLAQMIASRMQLRFTRSTVVEGPLVPWYKAPKKLQTVVNYCVAHGAYKEFAGKTVGHFAYMADEPNTIITSIRKSNFNQLTDMVKIRSSGEDQVIAVGAKPSVGGQSQRIIFKDHPGYTNIVHFHVPLLTSKVGLVPVVQQWKYECGSHECGQQTSDNLVEVAPGIKAVYLENHGPNIVFRDDVDPNHVINWITNHFDLRKSTRPGASL